jgi:hypothetical protein
VRWPVGQNKRVSRKHKGAWFFISLTSYSLLLKGSEISKYTRKYEIHTAETQLGQVPAKYTPKYDQIHDTFAFPRFIKDRHRHTVIKRKPIVVK